MTRRRKPANAPVPSDAQEFALRLCLDQLAYLREQRLEMLRQFHETMIVLTRKVKR